MAGVRARRALRGQLDPLGALHGAARLAGAAERDGQELRDERWCDCAKVCIQEVEDRPRAASDLAHKAEKGRGAKKGKGDGEAEILYRERLVWAATKCGVAAEQEPLPVSVWEEGCVWRKAGLTRLEQQGKAYRIAFKSAHISGQRAAILADLAVAPLPVSALNGSVVEADPKCGLPELPEYALGMIMAEDASPPVKAAGDHLRACFSAMHG